MSGVLLIVAAPSGAGKSTLVNALLAREPGMQLSISHTTRAPRPGEGEGRHYHFVARAEFDASVAAGEFLEHAEVHGNGYGTARAPIAQALAARRDVILEIDWQGARQVRASMPEAVSVFILPPSRVELERRLRARATDSAETIARRLAGSREEMLHALEFDYLLVNDRFEQALDDLRAIVRAEHLRTAHARQLHAVLLQDLLKSA
jgi:guanylate kinase